MRRTSLETLHTKEVVLTPTEERLRAFQLQYPYRFRQVFELHQKGKQALAEGKIAVAKGNFIAALNIYKDYIPTINDLAVVFEKQGDYVEALKRVKNVLKLDEKNVFATIHASFFTFYLGRLNEAKRLASKAIAFFREQEGSDSYADYDMLQKIVELLSTLCEHKKLIELYEEKSAFLSPVSIYLVAKSLYSEGRADEAVTLLHSISDKHVIKRKALELIETITPVEKSKEQGLSKDLPKDDSPSVTSEALSEQFAHLTKDKLILIAKSFGVKGYSKFKKQELISYLVEEILSQSPENVIEKVKEISQ